VLLVVETSPEALFFYSPQKKYHRQDAENAEKNWQGCIFNAFTQQTLCDLCSSAVKNFRQLAQLLARIVTGTI